MFAGRVNRAPISRQSIEWISKAMPLMGSRGKALVLLPYPGCPGLLIHVPWFDQSTCSFVPTCHCNGSRAQALSNSSRSGGTGATRSPAWGEHGEDPQFDRAEHDGHAPAYEGGIVLPSAGKAYQASRVKRSSYRIANWFIASFQWWTAVPQPAVILRKANQISLLAASSVGK